MSDSTENNPQAAKSDSPGKKTLGMPGKILVGLGIGILTGLFLSELDCRST
jgi:predicted ABC-type sugar transport system permease subunit